MSIVNNVKYRPDIDGLRAISVLAVIAYHFKLTHVFGYPIATGGYVGVDIFFVISGFLISSIIANDLKAGTYSMAVFYAKRVKRIFPALFAMYAVCLMAAAYTSIGKEIADIKNSVLSSVFFISNVYFSTKSGYFDGDLQANPLLHTWSLSVEEQFYVVFPLVLYLLNKVGAVTKMLIITAIFVAGLACSQYLVASSPDTAYYSVLARSWELFLGAGISFLRHVRLRQSFSEILTAAGLCLIFLAMVMFDKATVFPGAAALVPCLGAAAIIIGGNQATLTTRLLSTAPLRFTGVISYSLYLWHWPVFVFFSLYHTTGTNSAIALFVVTYVMAFLSWKYIETPFRGHVTPATTRNTLYAGGLAMGAATAFSFAAVGANHMIRPPSEQVEAIQGFVAHYNAGTIMREGTCFLTSKAKSVKEYQPEICLREVPHKPTLLVLGDSHSAQYWQAFADAFPDMNVLQASASGCYPVYGTKGESRCVELWKYMTSTYLPSHKVDAIVLIARWSKDSISPAIDTAGKLTAYAKHVVIIGPNVEYNVPLPKLLMESPYQHPHFLADHLNGDVEQIDAEFLKRPLGEGISYVSYFKAMCNGACPSRTASGEPTLFDDNHLTRSAAREFLDKSRQSFL
jgi:peptidoglycan/LPS O-acetylase OafA/YrhL